MAVTGAEEAGWDGQADADRAGDARADGGSADRASGATGSDDGGRVREGGDRAGGEGDGSGQGGGGPGDGGDRPNDDGDGPARDGDDGDESGDDGEGPARDGDEGDESGDGEDGSGDGSPGTDLCNILADERTRTVLATVADEPLPVKEIAARSGVSTATIYRRVDDLVDHDLLAAETRIDADGNHFTAYRSKVERVVVEVDATDGSVTADLTYRDAADQFVQLWEGLSE